MKKYLGKIKQCIKGFTTTQFQQIPREENMEADVLAKAASTNEMVGDQIRVQYIPSIEVLEVNQIDKVANCTILVMSYLKDGVLPEDKEEARKLRVKAARFVLIDEVLYKRVFSQPYLRCLTPDEFHYFLKGVHKGACGNHSRAKSLIHKIDRVGYYWLSMQADAKAYVKACDKCQCV